MGGTCTGEHGIGMHKLDALVAEHGEAVELMKTIKRALDPHNIMNPGQDGTSVGLPRSVLDDVYALHRQQELLVVVAARLARDQALRRAVSRSAVALRGTYNPDNRAFSPTALVPALHDGTIHVWDSLAIGEYLAERHPGMWPADPVARAWARSIAAEMHSGFSALRNEMAMCIRERVDVRPWSEALVANIARVEEIWTDSRRRFGQGGAFLCGAFSLADAFYAPGRVSLPDLRRAAGGRGRRLPARAARASVPARMGERGAGRNRRSSRPTSRGILYRDKLTAAGA